LSDAPLIKGGLRGDPPAYRHSPYQGGIKGGLKAKSIFNLIITSYLIEMTIIPWEKFEEEYAKSFPENKGAPALPFRVALASLIIQ
jgi:hypothetical protein